jgi:hypothetical protein
LKILNRLVPVAMAWQAEADEGRHPS